MRRQLHWFFVALALAVLTFLATVWAGAAALPSIGPALQKSARAEAPLTTAYMLIGRVLRGADFLRDYGDDYASDAFAPLAEHITSSPELAMELAYDDLRSARQRTLVGMHWVPWIALAIAGLLYWRRPRAVHLYGTRRR